MPTLDATFLRRPPRPCRWPPRGAPGSGSHLARRGRPAKESRCSSRCCPRARYADRFAIAREAGFVGTEMHTTPEPGRGRGGARRLREDRARIHSVMNSDHWHFPLSSADPEVVNKSVAGMETSLRNAKLWGAGTVLLVPAVVDAEDVVRRRLDAVAAGDPRAHPAARRRAEGRRRGRGGLEQVPAEPARVRALRRRVRLAVGEGLLRRRQRRLLRVPAGLDPHPRRAHRAGCTSRTSSSIATRARSSGRTSAKATSTGWRCARRFSDIELRRLHDDGDQRRRRRVLEGCVDADRPVPGRRAAGGRPGSI